MKHEPVLVIAPHCLDEVLGCGGTMAMHAATGCAVHVLVLSGDGTGHDATRRVAAHEAAGILGCQPPLFAGFPENRSDTVALSEFIEVIERMVTNVRPGTVYVSHSGSLNIDHQTAFRAAATALRPMPGASSRHFAAYEVPSSTDWAPPGIGEAFRPTSFVEITSVLDKKMRALQAYACDMRPEPHARSMKAVENRARTRGASVGLSAAEAFVVLRRIERI